MTARIDFAYSLRDQAPLNSRMRRLLFGPFGGPMIHLVAVAVPLLAVVAAGYIAGALAPPDFYLPVLLGCILVLGAPALALVRVLNLAWARRATGARTLDGA